MGTGGARPMTSSCLSPAAVGTIRPARWHGQASGGASSSVPAGGRTAGYGRGEASPCIRRGPDALFAPDAAHAAPPELPAITSGGTSRATQPDSPRWPAPRLRRRASHFGHPAPRGCPSRNCSPGRASSSRRGCLRQLRRRCCHPSPAAPARRDHADQLQGGPDSHPVAGHHAGPDGHRYRGRLPECLAWLEADRQEADRRVVLVLGGRLQLHGDPIQAVSNRLAQHGAVGLDHGAPVGGSVDRMCTAYHPALAVSARSRPGPEDRLPAGAGCARPIVGVWQRRQLAAQTRVPAPERKPGAAA